MKPIIKKYIKTGYEMAILYSQYHPFPSSSSSFITNKKYEHYYYTLITIHPLLGHCFAYTLYQLYYQQALALKDAHEYHQSFYQSYHLIHDLYIPQYFLKIPFQKTIQLSSIDTLINECINPHYLSFLEDHLEDELHFYLSYYGALVTIIKTYQRIDIDYPRFSIPYINQNDILDELNHLSDKRTYQEIYSYFVDRYLNDDPYGILKTLQHFAESYPRHPLLKEKIEYPLEYLFHQYYFIEGDKYE